MLNNIILLYSSSWNIQQYHLHHYTIHTNHSHHSTFTITPYGIHYTCYTILHTLFTSCEFKPLSQRGVLDTTLCDKVCQWLATGRWFSPVSSTNKTDRHDITEILLKLALNTINQTKLVWFRGQTGKRTPWKNIIIKDIYSL